MPVTVKVNGVANSLVHKGSNGISIATIPDVCKTPSPAGPVPIPYPNISQSVTLAKGTTTVKADGGMMIATKGSEFSLSNGDNPGVAGGVKSSTFMKESTWILYSFDVKMDGNNACRFSDKKFQNHENTVDLGGVLQPPVVPMAGGGADAQMAVLEGEVQEVSWLNGLPIKRDKAKVAGPHWTPGGAVHEEDDATKQHFNTGSKKPALFTLASVKNAKLKVKINVTKSEQQPGEGKLVGYLRSLRFEASCPPSAGVHEVELTLTTGLPTAVRHFEGEVQWVLSTSKSICNLKNKTRLEMFVVYADPVIPFADGVWAEALRFLFKKAGVANMKNAADLARTITRFCHTRHGVTYDTASGAPHFGSSNLGTSRFALMKYMRKDGTQGNVVNCYDQAAAIQSLCAAMGIRLDWIYLDPYGFINPTSLVGVGLCNNPFYKSNGSTAMVARDSPERTAFGNHAFARLGQHILDACAGPHASNETLSDYMRSAIDARRSLGQYRDGDKLKDEDYWRYLESLPNPHGGVTGVV